MQRRSARASPHCTPFHPHISKPCKLVKRVTPRRVRLDGNDECAQLAERFSIFSDGRPDIEDEIALAYELAVKLTHEAVAAQSIAMEDGAIQSSGRDKERCTL
jgi:hypothetical protein